MRKFIIFVSLIAAISLSSAYTDAQQAMITGVQLSWKMSAANQAGDIQAYNDLLPAWDAWVRANFGEDGNLLAVNQTAPVDLSKPYIAANNTTSSGIVHQIDGSNTGGAKYTTNDMNLLPDPGNISQIQRDGGAWLGGI